jgi:hypothetical protein
LVSPNIGKFLRAGRFFFSFSRDIANQDFAVFPVKIRKYIIIFFASLLFRLINANISVIEQPEWFHWATGGHFIHTVCHVHVLDHGHFTDIVSTLAI